MASLLDLLTQATPNLQTRKALIVLGLQNDFLSPDGKLPVPLESGFLDRLKELVPSFREHGDIIWVRSEFEANREPGESGDTIIAGSHSLVHDAETTQKGAKRSASQRNATPSKRVKATDAGGDPELFLTRTKSREPCCLRGSWGAKPPADIEALVKEKDLEVTKTFYSAFGSTSLLLTLRSRLITELFVVGCNTNLSVFATAMDAARYGIKITLVEDCLGYRQRPRHDEAIKQLKDIMSAAVMTSDKVIEALVNPPEEEEEEEEEEDSYDEEDDFDEEAEFQSAANLIAQTLGANTKPLPGSLDLSGALAADSDDDDDEDGDEMPLPQVRRPVSSRSPNCSCQVAFQSIPNDHSAQNAKPPGDRETPTNVAEAVDAKHDGKEVRLNREGDVASEIQQPSSGGVDVLKDAMLLLTLNATGVSYRNGYAAEQSSRISDRTLSITMQEDAGVDMHRARTKQLTASAQSQEEYSAADDQTQLDINLHFSKDESSHEPESHHLDSTSSNLLLEKINETTGSADRSNLSTPDLAGLARKRAHQQKASTTTTRTPGAMSQPLFGFAREQESEGSTIHYDLLPPDLSRTIFDHLLAEVEWETMRHQTGEVPRLVNCQGTISDDDGGKQPIYRHPSDETLPLHSWTSNVDVVRRAAEQVVGHELNHALIQLYRSGTDFISEHSDKTLDIVPGSKIVNVSFGAERTMRLRTKRARSSENARGAQRTTHRVPLPHNSMLCMSLPTNAKYLHSIPADKRPAVELSEAEKANGGRRISLTFRQIGTFLDTDKSTIWGQGAPGKTREQAKPALSGDREESERLVRMFGEENAGSEYREDIYAEGSNVLHLGKV